VIETHDAMMLSLAGRPLQFFDSPGHARHHHCVWDQRSQGLFTGDTFGVAYPEFTTELGAWLIPATPPTQFDPDALRTSVQRLLRFDPKRIYLTHYGEATPVAKLGATFLERLEQIVQLGETLRAHPQRLAALQRGLAGLYQGWLREHHCPLEDTAAMEILQIDIELNAQGMHHWLA
jgi:glyoxylase-like metal-dependent hydrolase (beta-lactamase superfamily II)